MSPDLIQERLGRYETLIEPVVGSEPNTVQLSSIQSSEMVVSVEDSFDEGRRRDATTDRDQINSQIAATVGALTGTERRVVQKRFGIVEGGAQPRSIRQVAAELGIPKSTVFDSERRALKKLKHPSSGRQLREYVL